MGAFIQIQQGTAIRDMETTVASPGETESDDQVAYREAMEKGYLTDEETIYFGSVGLLSTESRS